MYYLDKIKFHLKNWYYFIKEHLVGIFFFILLIIFFIITIFKLNIVNIYEKTDTGENGNFISQTIFIADITIENWQTWFTIVGFGYGLIWALYQYNKHKKEKQQEKAAEIAKEFANNLVERMGVISAVLMRDIEVKNKIATIIKSKKLSQFTTIEIESILDDPKCFESFTKTIHSTKIQQTYSELLCKKYSDIEQKKFETFFPTLIENTLNRLESICINISSQAAGSQFIYNSLHQSFLNNVEVLSIEISSNNNNNVDKYYTNIIAVYNMWNKTKKKDVTQLKKTNLKIQKLTIKAEKEVKKLLNKRNETV